MIIRKPYAFIIRHFRLLHIILSALMIALVFQTLGIMNFFSDYMSGFATTVESGTVDKVFFSSYLIVAFIIVLFALIGFALMKYKHKPSKLYLYVLITYINYFIFYMLTYSVVKGLEVTLVSVKEIKIYRDLALIFLILQGIGILFSIIRSTGLNMKKFGFKDDLDELEINAKDNEEVEISVDVDTSKLKRNFRRTMRHIKYMYVENKMVIIFIFVGAILLTGSTIALNKFVFNKKYSSLEVLQLNGYDLEIIDSYLTNRDYDNNEIYKDKEVLVVRVRAKSVMSKALDVGNFYLNIGKKNYYHKYKYNSNIDDLGKLYNDEKLKDEYMTYLLVFEIPPTQIDKEMILYYNSSDNIKPMAIEIYPKNLDSIGVQTKEASLKKELVFENSVLRNSKLTIDSYEIGNVFTVSYKRTIGEEEFDYKEYIKPKGLKKYKTTILKLIGTFTLDSKLIESNIKDIASLISYYGRMSYYQDGNLVETNMKLNAIESKYKSEKEYYIEIPDEIKDSEKIDIVFNVRNKKYVYHLK